MGRKTHYVPNRRRLDTRMDQVPPGLYFRNPFPLEVKRWWKSQGVGVKALITIFVLCLAINAGAFLGEMATRLLGMK